MRTFSTLRPKCRLGLKVTDIVSVVHLSGPPPVQHLRVPLLQFTKLFVEYGQDHGGTHVGGFVFGCEG